MALDTARDRVSQNATVITCSGSSGYKNMGDIRNQERGRQDVSNTVSLYLPKQLCQML